MKGGIGEKTAASVYYQYNQALDFDHVCF